MAREMYLAGVSKEELQPSPKLEPPRTPKAKWENFWYHYKWAFLGTIFGVLALAVIIVQMATVNRADYHLILVTEYALLDTQLDPLEQTLAQYGRDLDGDGEVEVQILHRFMGQEGSTERANNTQALQANLIAGDVMLFIWEPAYYEDFMQKVSASTEGDYAFFCPLPFEAGTQDNGTVWSWRDRHKDIPELAGLPNDWVFGVRIASDLVAGSADLQQEGLELLTAFATDTKPTFDSE